MIHQQVYDYVIKNIPDHLENDEYIADEYVKAGYGQIKGGYFDVAYKNDVLILKKEAEPSQKWHLIFSYYNGKIENNFNMQSEANLYRIMCPQLMLWIAEIAGLNKDVLKSAKVAAINYEKNNNTKNSRVIKKMVLKSALHWDKITTAIKYADKWEDVINEVSKIK